MKFRNIIIGLTLAALTAFGVRADKYPSVYPTLASIPCSTEIGCAAFAHVQIGAVTVGSTTGMVSYSWHAVGSGLCTGSYYYRPSGSATGCWVPTFPVAAPPPVVWSSPGATLVLRETASSAGTGYLYNQTDNTSGVLQWGVEGSATAINSGGSAYSGFLATGAAHHIQLAPNNVVKYDIAPEAVSVVQNQYGLGIGRSADYSAGPPVEQWILDMELDLNSQLISRITNQSTGPYGEAKYAACNDLVDVLGPHCFDLGLTGKGFAPAAGIYGADTGIIHSSATVLGGIGIAAGHGPINISADNDITHLTATFINNMLGIGVVPTHKLDVYQSTNGSATILLTNDNAGAATTAELDLANGTSTMLVRQNGASYTTSGIFRQDGGLIFDAGAGGLTLATVQPLYFAVNNAEVGNWNATRLNVDNALTVAGLFTLSNNLKQTGTEPTLSSCGTSPAFAGGSTDTQGTVVEGTTATGCTLTWASAKSASPSCVVSQRGALTNFVYAMNTTILVVTNDSHSGGIFDYFCIQH